MNDTDKIIEDAVAELYRGLFRLRKAGKYQEEYDLMGTILTMLMQDRQHMRETFELNV